MKNSISRVGLVSVGWATTRKRGAFLCGPFMPSPRRERQIELSWYRQQCFWLWRRRGASQQVATSPEPLTHLFERGEKEKTTDRPSDGKEKVRRQTGAAGAIDSAKEKRNERTWAFVVLVADSGPGVLST